MTFSTFLRKLRTAKTHGFQPLYSEGKLRFWKDKCFCPLTCVCAIVTGKTLGLGDFHHAASALELDISADDIILAADTRSNKCTLVGKKLRRALINASFNKKDVK